MPRARSPSRSRRLACHQDDTRSDEAAVADIAAMDGLVVAIVGASFAGLALARALQIRGATVHVFERSLALGSPFLAGSVYVPSIGRCARALGLDLELRCAQDIRGQTPVGGTIGPPFQSPGTWDGQSTIDQHQLLLLLAQSLRPGTVRLGARVSGPCQCGSTVSALGSCGAWAGGFFLGRQSPSHKLSRNVPKTK